MKEVTVDTNVLVSALISPHGNSRKVLNKIASGEVRLVISPRLLLELVTVFSRAEMRALIPESRISDLVSLVHLSARVVKPVENIEACRDPKDNPVLECAVSGKVDFIISGDKDLLDLSPFRRISILKPKDFLSALSR